VGRSTGTRCPNHTRYQALPLDLDGNITADKDKALQLCFNCHGPYDNAHEECTGIAYFRCPAPRDASLPTKDLEEMARCYEKLTGDKLKPHLDPTVDPVRQDTRRKDTKKSSGKNRTTSNAKKGAIPVKERGYVTQEQVQSILQDAVDSMTKKGQGDGSANHPSAREELLGRIAAQERELANLKAAAESEEGKGEPKPSNAYLTQADVDAAVERRLDEAVARGIARHLQRQTTEDNRNGRGALSRIIGAVEPNSLYGSNEDSAEDPTPDVTTPAGQSPPAQGNRSLAQLLSSKWGGTSGSSDRHFQ